MKNYKERNQELFKQLKNCQEGSKEYDKILTEIFDLNHKLTFSTVNNMKIKISRSKQEDVWSAANLGLFRAIKKFDADKGIEFSTFASACIEHAVQNFLKVNFRQEIRIKVKSFDDIIGYAEDGREITVMSMLKSSSSEEEIVDRLNIKNENKNLHKLVDSLPKKQREVINLRYFSGNELKAFQYIGNEIGRSKQGVGKTEKRALKNLRMLYKEQLNSEE